MFPIVFNHKFDLGRFTISESGVMCLQNFGHVSSDNKIINILTGQGSCRVKCPMPCYMACPEKHGNPLEWIQRALLEGKVKTKTDKDEDYIIPRSSRMRGGLHKLHSYVRTIPGQAGRVVDGNGSREDEYTH